MSEQSAADWDEAAATFDQAADHGLGDPDVRSAWADLLTRMLPPPPSRLADLGCGTGSLALLAADLGHDVEGIDFSEQMLAIARAKTRGRTGVRFAAGDAADPPLTAGAFDAVLCRHVLWALPHPDAAIQRWSQLLRPTGWLVLIEGRWSTGSGLSSQQIVALLRRQRFQSTVESLADSRYWGAAVNDDRYVVLAQKENASGKRLPAWVR